MIPRDPGVPSGHQLGLTIPVAYDKQGPGGGAGLLGYYYGYPMIYKKVAIYAEPWVDQAGMFEGAPAAASKYLGDRSQTIYGGTNEIKRNLIAKRILGI